MRQEYRSRSGSDGLRSDPADFLFRDVFGIPWLYLPDAELFIPCFDLGDFSYKASG